IEPSFEVLICSKHLDAVVEWNEHRTGYEGNQRHGQINLKHAHVRLETLARNSDERQTADSTRQQCDGRKRPGHAAPAHKILRPCLLASLEAASHDCDDYKVEADYEVVRKLHNLTQTSIRTARYLVVDIPKARKTNGYMTRVSLLELLEVASVTRQMMRVQG